MVMMPLPLRVLVLLLSISVVLTVVLWGLQRRLIYLPAGAPPPVGDVLPAGDAVRLETADGLTLDAWWVPGGPTAVVVLPGNAGNRAGRAPLARDLRALGLSVLLVDYRGYGGNPGSPTEDGLVADARAAFTWVEDRGGVERVVLFGESLGAAVALAVAVDRPPAALVLRSPFTSLLDVARVHYGPVPAVLLRDRFPSEGRIAEVEVPVLVLASEDDEIVPFAQSRRLAEAGGADVALVRVPARGHNDPALLHGDVVIDAVGAFLGRRGLLPPP